MNEKTKLIIGIILMVGIVLAIIVTVYVYAEQAGYFDEPPESGFYEEYLFDEYLNTTVLDVSGDTLWLEHPWVRYPSVNDPYPTNYLIWENVTDNYLGAELKITFQTFDVKYRSDTGSTYNHGRERRPTKLEITGFDQSYITEYNEFQNWLSEMEKLEFTATIDVDLSDFIDIYGAGMHNTEICQITISNPTEHQLPFKGEYFNYETQVNIFVPTGLSKTSLHIIPDFTALYISPNTSITRNVSFEIFGTSPGVFEHGDYKIILYQSLPGYYLHKNIEIERTYINVRLGEA